MTQSLNISLYIHTVAESPLLAFEDSNIIPVVHQLLLTCAFFIIQVGLSQMRSHTAACSKYQEYIEEGVRTTAQSQPAIIR